MLPAENSRGFRESKLYTATRVTVWKSSAAVHNSNKLGWAGAQSRLKQLAWSLVQGKAKNYLFTGWNLNVFKFSFNKHFLIRVKEVEEVIPLPCG